MKNYITIALLFFGAAAFGQKTDKKSEYAKMEIIKTDGSKMTVLGRKVTFPGYNLLGNSENANVRVEYKNSEDGPVQKMYYKDVAYVKVLDKNMDELHTFERLKIKQFDKTNKLIDTKKIIYLTQLYDGKIGIYGHGTTSCQNISKNPITQKNQYIGCEYLFGTFYLKNNQENFAISPLDIKFFNLDRSLDNFVNAFKVAGKECEEFNKYLETLREKMQDKDFQKKLRQDMIAYRKEVKKEAKDLDLSSEEKANYIATKIFTYEAQFFIGVVKEYEKNCP